MLFKHVVRFFVSIHLWSVWNYATIITDRLFNAKYLIVLISIRGPRSLTWNNEQHILIGGCVFSNKWKWWMGWGHDPTNERKKTKKLCLVEDSGGMTSFVLTESFVLRMNWRSIGIQIEIKHHVAMKRNTNEMKFCKNNRVLTCCKTTSLMYCFCNNHMISIKTFLLIQVWIRTPGKQNREILWISKN